MKNPKNIRRPEKLDADDIQKIFEEITRLHNNQSYQIYPTFNDIFDFVYFTLKKSVKIDSKH